MGRRMTVDEVLSKIDEFIERVTTSEQEWDSESTLRALKAEIQRDDIRYMRGEQS